MWMMIRADLEASVDRYRVVGVAFWIKVVGKALITPQTQAVVLFRLGSALARTPLRPFAFVLRALALAWSGAEIHPDARIGPGFALVHSSGVVIGHGVRIGADCRLNQGVTLGEQGRGGRVAAWGFPELGDHVTVGAHAVILGPRRIGTGAVVGANAVVTTDLPDGAVAVGIPARVVRTVPLDEVLAPRT
jgi:serine O-acetyltransferase